MDHNIVLLIFQFIVFIFSVMIHEISHGYVAERMGDPTARLAGRLTLNPLKHLDPFGSILLPILLYIATGGAIVFGWAKPVPYNPFNLKDPKSAAGKIAAAGPISNFLIALVFGILLRFGVGIGNLATFFGLIVYLNILLGVFNLVPIPPLDGSKVLFAFLPNSPRAARATYVLERYGIVFLFIFIFFGFQIIIPIINFLFTLITGGSTGF